MALRIVSLVPSLTELVAWLAGPAALVGRTTFCTEPAGIAASVPALGGTKNPRVAAIAALSPDLVVANKEENRREDVEALRAAGCDVLLTEIDSIEGALAVIASLGERLGARPGAEALIAETREVLALPPPAPATRVAVPIWWNPLLLLGGQTYGNDLLRCAGAENILAGRPRYPEIPLADLAGLRPDRVLLPDEPFPFDASHVPAFEAVAPAQCIDGKLLWWYGPRLPASLRTLRALLARPVHTRP